MTASTRFGRQVCGSLETAAAREWLVTDGCGGFAMGTVAGLRTRRYHGLLVVATEPPNGRRMALAALDPVLTVDGRQWELATHEWADGTIAPSGFEHLQSFAVIDGVPRWRWSVAGVVLQAEVAMAHGRPGVGVAYRLLAGPPCSLAVGALCTWRDWNGERYGDGAPTVSVSADGFVFEGAYAVRGTGFVPDGRWYVGALAREEQARGLNPTEDLWMAGSFHMELSVGGEATIEAWPSAAGPPGAATELVARARARARDVAVRAGAATEVDARLAHAADQFVVVGSSGPTVIAGYPWFGCWSRDTMTSYEGLFLVTGRAAEGAELLRAAAATVSEGMLANTADAGGTEFNTVDGTLWFLHAIGRHVEVAGDDRLAIELWPAVAEIVARHERGTRFGIRVDADGLLTQGAPGCALTWMDALVDGAPVTPRWGKAVEVNALWVRGLTVAGRIARTAGADPAAMESRRAQAVASFVDRFVRPDGAGLFDVVDGPAGDDASVRPNQLLAVSLPNAPIDASDVVAAVLEAVRPLVTSLGLRSLSPSDPAYRGRHRGGPAERDAAYHQGTVWPWWIGPYVDALRRLGPVAPSSLDGLQAHLDEWGLGSVSETADGDPPHAATGCPFQAWSVAELIRVRRLVSPTS